MARQTGKRVAQPVPPLPPAAAHVWGWFVELAGRRTWGPTAPNPLPFAEVEAWARLTGRVVRDWEARLLMALDDCWLACMRPEEPTKP